MKNNDNLDKFISELETIKMTSNEKNKIQNHLESFAKSYAPILSPYDYITLMLKRGAAVAFITLISLGSLSNFASNGALPGETLYPVKIAHEEIKLATTVDTKNKISYEIKRTEKRIQEATKLAIQNELDKGTQSIIAENIKKQADKVKEHIEIVKEKDPEEALILNSELKSTIKINKEALRKATTKEKEKEANPLKDTEDNIETVPDTEEKNTVMNESEVKDNNINYVEEKDNLIEEVIGEVLENPGIEPILLDSVSNKQILLQKNKEILVEIEFSFAESLLESIEEEVQEIEAYEEKVTQEIVEEENKLSDEDDELLNQETLTDEQLETKTDLPILKESQLTELVIERISSLEEILEIQKRIIKIKKGSKEDLLILQINENNIEEIIFSEKEIRKDADILIDKNKYKNAFILLKNIFEKYQEHDIQKEVDERELISAIRTQKLDIVKFTQKEKITNLEIPVILE
jgi:hypothetical protein